MLGPLIPCFLLTSLPAPQKPPLQVDFARRTVVFRPLHGINKGPLGLDGLVDVTSEQHALALPYVRLHDCHWPNPDVVDIHVVFPDPSADPEEPIRYVFRLTDRYVLAVRDGRSADLPPGREHRAHRLTYGRAVVLVTLRAVTRGARARHSLDHPCKGDRPVRPR